MKSTYTGPATVFRHDKNGRTFYSVAVSRKDSSGETQFAYKMVQFKKGVDLSDRAKIDIKNGWETFYNDRNGNTVFYVFISDFVLNEGSAAGYQPAALTSPPQRREQTPIPNNFEQVDEEVPW